MRMDTLPDFTIEPVIAARVRASEIPLGGFFLRENLEGRLLVRQISGPARGSHIRPHLTYHLDGPITWGNTTSDAMVVPLPGVSLQILEGAERALVADLQGHPR